jgi:undecaprenyl-diphosphatase
MRRSQRAAAALTLRTVATFAAAIAAAFVFVAIAVAVVDGRAGVIDEPVARAVGRIRQLDAPLLDAIIAAITHAGGRPVVALAIAVTAAFAARRRYWRAVWVLIATGLAAWLLNALLKLLFARERPALQTLIPLPESYSFPSGHAMSALAVYGAIAVVVIALAPRARAAVLAVTVLLVLAIGLSRLYLGVHWPLDVLAGFAAAVPLLVAAVLLLRAPPERIARSSS